MDLLVHLLLHFLTEETLLALLLSLLKRFLVALYRIPRLIKVDVGVVLFINEGMTLLLFVVGKRYFAGVLHHVLIMDYEVLLPFHVFTLGLPLLQT